jgi:hypothetical protein
MVRLHLTCNDVNPRALKYIGPKSTLHPAQEGINGVKGAEVVDGVDDCVREVRRQIGAGADWIKVGGFFFRYQVVQELTNFIFGVDLHGLEFTNVFS